MFAPGIPPSVPVLASPPVPSSRLNIAQSQPAPLACHRASGDLGAQRETRSTERQPNVCRCRREVTIGSVASSGCIPTTQEHVLNVGRSRKKRRKGRGAELNQFWQDILHLLLASPWPSCLRIKMRRTHLHALPALTTISSNHSVH